MTPGWMTPGWMTPGGSELVAVAPGIRLATWTRVRPGMESPPVVLVHGGPGLWSAFDDLVDLLDQVAVVHTYDQRGCGRSTADEGVEVEQSLARAVDDLEALRCHWGHDQWVVVGHSAGADLALAHAAAHPEAVLALVHLSGRGIGDRSAEKAEERRRRGPFTARWEELSAIRDRGWEQEVEWRELAWLPDYADPVLGADHRRAMAGTRLEVNLYANHLVRATDTDLLSWAAATECPVTFVHGSGDPRPVANVLPLAAVAPRARKRIVQGAGHFPWVERPVETAELLHEAILTT